MSFRLKTVLGIALIEALLLTILVISGLNYLSSSNATQLERRAATTAKLVATMTGDAVIAVDLATLDVLVDQALRNPDLVYLRIRSANGTMLSEGGEKAALAAAFVEDQTVEQASNDRRLDVSAPITVAGAAFGRVELGLSTATLNATFGDALVWMVSIALSEMILVALLGLALGHYLTRQLILLKHGAKKVADGDFGHQLPIQGKDELAETAESFNGMSTALARYAAIAEEARQKAEAGRERAESTLQDALDSMRDHVLVIDDHGQVVLANQSYRSLYCAGRAPSDAESAFVAEAALIKSAPGEFISESLRRLAEPLAHPRWEMALADGRRFLVAQHPMSRGGVVIVQTDVSELYQALEENRQLQNELIQQKKSEAVATLAGGLAHEINTPVQVIADNAKFIADSLGDVFDLIDVISVPNDDKASLADKLDAMDWAFLRAEIPASLADMAEGTKRVRDLIATFKQFAKLDGTTVTLVDLADVVRSAIDDTRTTWETIAEVRANIQDGMPPVPCQTGQIKQVIQHLIVNATHAIDDRRAGELGLISIELTYDRSRAMLIVEDNGCGIEPEHLDRIYDVLFTTKEPGRGSGQGLALSHMFVTRGHGGQINVVSEPGKGTRFEIVLPLDVNQPTEDARSQAQPSAADDRTMALS